MQIKTRTGREDVSYLVDEARIAWVVPLGDLEPVTNRDTGETLSARRSGLRLWTVRVGVPGVTIAGMSGLAELDLTLETNTPPTIERAKPYKLVGPVTVKARVETVNRNERRAFVSLRAGGVERATPGPNQTAQHGGTGVSGIPIHGSASGAPLFVLAADRARNAYDGSPIVGPNGAGLQRLQVHMVEQHTRRDTGEAFERTETVFVDVPLTAWEATPVPFCGSVTFTDLRFDARVTDRGGLTRTFAAAGYIVADDLTITPAVETPAPSTRRGQSSTTTITDDAPSPVE